MFRLCFVKDNCAWFTDSFEHQWGDDWNDKPYEYNAGEPYEHWFDSNNVEHPIGLTRVYFELYDNSYLLCPCDSGSFSVEEINNGIIPWIYSDNFKLFARYGL